MFLSINCLFSVLSTLLFSDVYKLLLAKLNSGSSAYVRYSFHSNDAEIVHIMAMLLRPQASILPHRSLKAGFNYYQVVSGSLLISKASNSKQYCEPLLIDNSCAPLRVDRTAWRRLTNNTNLPCFYLETTSGPFIPGSTVWV